MRMIIMLFVLYGNKFYTAFNGTYTWLGVRYWNNAKRFLVAFSGSWKSFNLKSFKNHTFMTSTRKGSGSLEISPVFADSVVFKQ